MSKEKNWDRLKTNFTIYVNICIFDVPVQSEPRCFLMLERADPARYDRVQAESEVIYYDEYQILCYRKEIQKH